MAVSVAKYYDAVKAGNVFIGSTAAAGVAYPISTGTAVTCAIWNTSANKDAVILSVNVGATSGTIALGEIGLANQYVGFAEGTGAPLAAITRGTPKNAYTGYGKSSAMTFVPATATLTAGGTALLWSGYSIESATPGLGIFSASWPVDGQAIVTPGQIVFVCGSIAQTGIFTISMVWEEIDR